MAAKVGKQVFTEIDLILFTFWESLYFVIYCRPKVENWNPQQKFETHTHHCREWTERVQIL